MELAAGSKNYGDRVPDRFLDSLGWKLSQNLSGTYLKPISGYPEKGFR